MKLYLVRHATAVEHLGGDILRDQDRPLTDDGRTEAHLMASALRKVGIGGDAFFASPYVRTRQTAEVFAEVLGPMYTIELSQALAPGGEPAQLYERLSSLKQAEHIFLFTHMPDICQLAGALLFTQEIDMQFKKAAVCCLEMYDMPPTRAGSLRWMVTPKLVQAFKK